MEEEGEWRMRESDGGGRVKGRRSGGGRVEAERSMRRRNEN